MTMPSLDECTLACQVDEPEVDRLYSELTVQSFSPSQSAAPPCQISCSCFMKCPGVSYEFLYVSQFY